MFAGGERVNTPSVSQANPPPVKGRPAAVPPGGSVRPGDFVPGVCAAVGLASRYRPRRAENEGHGQPETEGGAHPARAQRPPRSPIFRPTRICQGKKAARLRAIRSVSPTPHASYQITPLALRKSGDLEASALRLGLGGAVRRCPFSAEMSAPLLTSPVFHSHFPLEHIDACASPSDFLYFLHTQGKPRLEY